MTDSIETIFQSLKSGNAARRTGLGLAERRAALDALARVIKRREAEIIAALEADFHKPAVEVTLTEILPVLQDIAHARKQLARWMRPRRVRPGLATFGTRARVEVQPRGTALVIAPWNYPFNLALGPLVSALAAGNAVVVKPSELAPATSALIASIVAEACDPALVRVIEGGQEVAETLTHLPFDHIFFTGSPAVGAKVMAAAATTLATVTLELGGKSPTVVGPGADLAKAADWITFGKFANAGQTCIAPDHLYVHDSIRESFVEILRARIGRAYGGRDDLALVVNDRHAARLRGALDEAVGKGARVILGGGGEGRALPATLIEAVTPEMALGREEIFGPVLPIMPFDDLDAVLVEINARPNPLALYVFDKDRDFIDRVVRGTSSGGVGVNLTVLHYSHPNLPFGGAGASGHGSAHGHWGFLAFSHERAVLENRFSVLPMLFAPYTGRVKRLVRLARRVLG